MAELKYAGYVGSIEVSIEDGCLHGRIQFIDDLVTYEGDSVPEITESFQKAVDRYVAHCQRVGKPANKPYSGSFNVRIGPELHSGAAKFAHQKNIKLNEFVKRAIQAAIDLNGVVTHQHHHKHDVSVTVQESSSTRTIVAGMGEPIWESTDVKTH